MYNLKAKISTHNKSTKNNTNMMKEIKSPFWDVMELEGSCVDFGVSLRWSYGSVGLGVLTTPTTET